MKKIYKGFIALLSLLFVISLFSCRGRYYSAKSFLKVFDGAIVYDLKELFAYHSSHEGESYNRNYLHFINNNGYWYIDDSYNDSSFSKSSDLSEFDKEYINQFFTEAEDLKMTSISKKADTLFDSEIYKIDIKRSNRSNGSYGVSAYAETNGEDNKVCMSKSYSTRNKNIDFIESYSYGRGVNYYNQDVYFDLAFYLTAEELKSKRIMESEIFTG